MTHVERASWRGNSLAHAYRIRRRGDRILPPSLFAVRAADSLYWGEVDAVLRQMTGLAAIAMAFLAALLTAPMPTGASPCGSSGLGTVVLPIPAAHGERQQAS
jgi:hypothetical protein